MKNFDLSAFSKYPALAREIVAEQWRAIFSPQTLGRAEDYAGSPRLRSLQAIALGPARLVLEGRVQGNGRRDYLTSVFFERGVAGWGFYTDCSCPVEVDCKHAAGLFICAKRELEEDSRTPSTGQGNTLNQWLASVAESPPTPKKKAAKKGASNALLYCLREQGSGYELALRTGRLNKSGGWNWDVSSSPRADPMKPAKYMSESDITICSLYHRACKLNYSYGNLRLEGEGVGKLLTEIAKQAPERFFVIGEKRKLHSIEITEEVEAIPKWQRETTGSLRPSWETPLDGVEVILPTDPHFALEKMGESYRLIPLREGAFPLALAAKWAQGPTISPSEVTTVAMALSKQTVFPVPEVVAAEKLSKSLPECQLRLHRANPFSHAGLHFSGQPEPVIGDLSFCYHGHPIVPDLALPLTQDEAFFVASDESLLEVPRDAEQEAAALTLLEQAFQLIPASRWDGAVQSDHCGALLPVEAAGSWDEAMAHFIVKGAPTLRERGWTIEVDPSAQFAMRSIEEEGLESELNDLPEHGIDWFQFSASYLTPEGDRQPLLPLLTPFLKKLDFEEIGSLLESLPDDDETLLRDPERAQSFLLFPTKRLLLLAKTLHELFGENPTDMPLHRLQAATLADALEMDSSATLRALAKLGENLRDVQNLPRPKVPKAVAAELRDYQLDGFHWMQFLASHSLHGILADDMGLGKTLQALTHLQAEVSGRRNQKRPSLVIAPTSVVSNWVNEAAKFTPKLKTLLLQGSDRKEKFDLIPEHHLIITSYALLVRDFEVLEAHDFHLLILDEAQYIKNPAAKVSQLVCRLTASHRLSLSGTPLENHLGELWSQMRFLMPGILGSSEVFRKTFRNPIEKQADRSAQLNLNSRVSPLILRRTKEEVATELPPKTEILHSIPLNKKQVDLYETVRAAMDGKVRDAIADKGLAKSQIIVLDALLKLRQICCHPQLLKLAAAQKVKDSAKMDFLTKVLLPQLLEEGRKVLIFSTFTTLLQKIEDHLAGEKVICAKITGQTKHRDREIEKFQEGRASVFLISLKAGGTGLNLTAADTVIHYDPWWNPAAENQATDRAYRIGQDKPVFVHKLISEGTIEERIVELQGQKAKLVEALLSEKTNRLKIDQETLGNLLAPLS